MSAPFPVGHRHPFLSLPSVMPRGPRSPFLKFLVLCILSLKQQQCQHSCGQLFPLSFIWCLIQISLPALSPFIYLCIFIFFGQFLSLSVFIKWHMSLSLGDKKAAKPHDPLPGLDLGTRSRVSHQWQILKEVIRLVTDQDVHLLFT